MAGGYILWGGGPSASCRARPFFLGPRFSLADLTLACWLGYAEAYGMLSRIPALTCLLGETCVRPPLDPVMVRHADWMRRWSERVRDA